MQLRLAHIRLPVMIFLQLFAQPFELPSPHVFQVHAVRPRRRRFVKKYRYPVALPDFIAHAPRQRHAILNRYAFDGNKRQHIRRAYARVRPRMFCQIDQFHGLAGSQNGRFRHRVRIPRQRDHAPVMVGVHFAIQHINTRYAAHGCDNGIHLRRISPFGKIRHALNQSFHFFGFLSCFPAQFAGNFGGRSGIVGLSYTNTGFFPCWPG